MRTLTLRAAPMTALAIALSMAACHRASNPLPAPAPSRTEPAELPGYRTGEEVVAAMHDRYDRSWYSTITFRQKTSRLLPNGTWNEQTWYEAGHFPGRLRIDFDPISGGNGVLYARDSEYVVSNNRVVQGKPGINDLLLLGFDVYLNPVPRTMALLRKQGFDVSRVHTAEFEGRPMLVVGARAGDTKRKQFWVDAERLIFVRMLEPAPRDSTKVQDVRFTNYRKEGDAWVSPRVELYNDGKLVFHEDYSDIRTGVALDEALFDAKQWKTARHWMND